MELFYLIPAATGYAVITTMTGLFLLFVYRLTLHPLQRYPGPFLARFTNAYAGFYAGTMSLHIQTHEDHLKYGSVVRYGPNRLIFNSAQALKDIYLNDKLSKSHVFEHLPYKPKAYSIFDVIDKDTHRSKRKLIGQAISERSMRIFHPVMLDEVNTFLRILAASSGNPVNMSKRLKRLGMDIVGLLALGYPLKTQTEEKYRFLMDAHVFGTFRSNMYLQFPLFKTTRLYSILETLATAEVRRYFAVVEELLATRIAEDKNIRHDLYSLVADTMNPKGEHAAESELWAEVSFFFPAGGETTATLLSAAFFYLSHDSDIYNKLAKEIRSTFASGEEIVAGAKLASCHYLRACINETLRISPPVSGTLWRELCTADSSEASFVVDGHVIPRGTEVGVNMYAIHHNEEYFPEPFAFKPERWNELDQANGQNKPVHDAWVPFSLGARNCAGKAMAYQQANLVLAKTLWYFDFELAPGKLGEVGGGHEGLRKGRQRPNEFQLNEHIAASHDGPNLIFHPRGNAFNELMDTIYA